MEGDYSAVIPGDFDFSRGRRFQAEVLDRCRSSVHHPSSSLDGSFFMLAVFRRFTFRLTEESVSLALHSVLGGTPAGFHVHFESDRHFRFSVASKKVALHIRSVERFTTKHFDLYCFLWRDGMPNWEKDEIVWLKEQEKEWTTVTYRKHPKQQKNRVSFARNLVQPSPIRKSKPDPHHAANVKPASFPTVRNIRIGAFYCPLPASSDACKSKLVFPDQSSIDVASVFNKLQNKFEFFQNLSGMGQRAANTDRQPDRAQQKGAIDGHDHSPQLAPHWVGIQEKDTNLLKDNPAQGAFSLPSTTAFIPNTEPRVSRVDCIPPSSDIMATGQGSCHNWWSVQEKNSMHHSGQREAYPVSRESSERLCYRCLSPGHFVKHCQNEIRCRACYCYGHKECVCFRKRANQKGKWKIKEKHYMDKENHFMDNATASPEDQGPTRATRHAFAPQHSTRTDEQTRHNASALHSALAIAHFSPQLPARETAMVNFPVDPHTFVAPKMVVDPGGQNRRSREYVSVGGNIIRQHEEYIIAVDEDEEINPKDYGMFLEQIRQYVLNGMRMQEGFCCIHPHGIGLIQLDSSFHRERLIGANLHEIDGFNIRFISSGSDEQNTANISSGTESGSASFSSFKSQFIGSGGGQEMIIQLSRQQSNEETSELRFFNNETATEDSEAGAHSININVIITTTRPFPAAQNRPHNHNYIIEELDEPTFKLVPPGQAPNDHEAGSSSGGGNQMAAYNNIYPLNHYHGNPPGQFSYGASRNIEIDLQFQGAFRGPQITPSQSQFYRIPISPSSGFRHLQQSALPAPRTQRMHDSSIVNALCIRGSLLQWKASQNITKVYIRKKHKVNLSKIHKRITKVYMRRNRQDIMEPQNWAIVPYNPLVQMGNQQNDINMEEPADSVEVARRSYKKKIQQRIIKKTYTGRNRLVDIVQSAAEDDDESELLGGSGITVSGLRRSHRLSKDSDGHRVVQATTLSVSGRKKRAKSACAKESLQRLAAQAGNLPSSNRSDFIGPIKFPTLQDLEECTTTYPEISTQQIQQVAIHQCGVPSVEVTQELLMEVRKNAGSTEDADSSQHDVHTVPNESGAN